jgi:hypothetical protein
MPLEKLPPFPADVADGAGVAAYLLLRGLVGALRERGALDGVDIASAVLSAEQALEDMAMRRAADDPVMSSALGLLHDLAASSGGSPNDAG